MKYKWWLSENGMVEKFMRNPGPGWRGPYDTLRDLNIVNSPWRCGNCGNILPITVKQCPCAYELREDE